MALPRPRVPPCAANTQEQVTEASHTFCEANQVVNTLLYHSLVFFHRVTSLTRLPSALVELSEPLKVINYEHGDFSNAHHDSSPSHSETTCAHTRLAGNISALTEVSCRFVRFFYFDLFFHQDKLSLLCKVGKLS